MFDNLTEKNFPLFAAKCYEDPNCIDVLEFQQDVDRIKYIKRLFRRYEDNGDLKERLILAKDFIEKKEEIFFLTRTEVKLKARSEASRRKIDIFCFKI